MDKEKIWNKKLNIFRKTVDKLGKKIDPKILIAVVGINLNGLITEQSCQGHLRYGIASPWVNIIIPHSKKILTIYEKIDGLRKKTLVNENKKANSDLNNIWNEIHKLTKRKDILLSKNNNKIFNILSKFYSSRKDVSYDNRIIVTENYLGARLICQGYLLQNSRNYQEKKANLIEYRKEFSLFSDFLKDLFLHS